MSPQDTKINAMIEQAKEMSIHKVDYISPVSALAFDDDANIVISEAARGFLSGAKVTPMPQTDHAFVQICQKLGEGVFPTEQNHRLPVDYLQAISPKIRAMNLNDAIQHMPHKSGWTVRSFDGTARAIIDQHYFPFDNEPMLNILGAVLDEDGTPHRISSQSFVSPDAMRVDVLIGRTQKPPDQGGNKEWMWGVGVRNNEIGQGSGGTFAILKRGKCDNTIAVDETGYNYHFRHWAKKSELRNLIKTEFNVAIANILPFGAELIDQMIAADYQELPKFGDIVKGLSIELGWSDEFVGTVWQGTEGHNTQAGLINGVTYAAQTIEDPAARFEHELLGGSILVDPESVFYPALRALEVQNNREERDARREARKAERTSRR